MRVAPSFSILRYMLRASYRRPFGKEYARSAGTDTLNEMNRQKFTFKANCIIPRRICLAEYQPKCACAIQVG